MARCDGLGYKGVLERRKGVLDNLDSGGDRHCFLCTERYALPDQLGVLYCHRDVIVPRSLQSVNKYTKR